MSGSVSHSACCGSLWGGIWVSELAGDCDMECKFSELLGEGLGLQLRHLELSEIGA